MKKNLQQPNSKPMIQRGNLQANSQIVAVGGGKGGVGKSFVSTNIALFLANMGFKTVIVDLDLGAANAHTSLGEGLPKLSISDFLNGKVNSIEEIAMATGQPNLRLISGCNDDLETADLDIFQRSRLMSAIYNMNADYVVMDLSAGTHQTTLDFFLMAQHNLIVFTPEPSSIENAYRFMKASFYRKIKRVERQFSLEETVNEIMTHKDKFGVKNPADLMNAILKQEPEKGSQLLKQVNNLQFSIILNQTRTRKDTDIGHSVKSVSNKFFGTQAEFIGHLEYDNAVWQSLRKRKPLLVEYPHSHLYNQILNISKSIAYSNTYKAVV